MGKFGKKIEVSTDLSDYMIGVMAPSGFGKSTLMYQVCEKEFGPEGYIICDVGTEDGVAALQGAVAEPVPVWKKMKEMTDDIVKNKDTDYPKLKVLILDTLDATYDIAENFVTESWNRENMSKQGFTKATSINSVEGGFGKGMDRVIETVWREIKRLKEVGVQVWWNSHVKEKDQSDLYTGANYTSLTANMPMKYFNSIRNSSHIVAFGYFDRSIEKQEVGEANPMTKKKKERNAVAEEVRKIKFRDSALVADAKSRFSRIVDEIPLDADLFIKAIKDAIEAEKKGKPTVVKVEPKKSTKPVEEKPVVVEDPTIEPSIGDAPFDLDDEPATPTIDLEELCTKIRAAFKGADAQTKAQVKGILTERGDGKLSVSLGEQTLIDIATILQI